MRAETTDRTDLLLALGEALEDAVSVDEACSRTLDALLTASGADGASMVVREGAGAPRVRASRGRSEDLRSLEDRACQSLVGPDRIPHAIEETPGGSALAVPIMHRREPIGRLFACCNHARRFGPGEILAVQMIAAQLARTIARIALVESERQARLDAERSAAWMQRLVRVSAKLSPAFKVAAVAEVIVSEAFDAIGPDNGALWLLDPTRKRLEMLASRGYTPEMKQMFASFPLDDVNPLCHAVVCGQPVWIERWEDFLALFPASEATVHELPRPGDMSFACLPLHVDDKPIGGLSFTFLQGRRFEADERTFIGLLAQQCARGIERADLYDRALNAVRLRDDFLTVAGHELRTPLAALLLQAEVLLRTPDNTPGTTVRDRGALVLRSVSRLVKLSDELLDTSRITTGRLQLRREPVELAGLVEEVVARIAEGQRVRVTVHRDDGGPVHGQWDRPRLEQVVTNLLTNALKYGRGAPIDLRVGRAPDAATLTVQDRGIGISVADQTRIFERFERAASPQQFGGLGLGLWITREIVEAHGGQISVASRPEEGAAFTVVLPLGPVESTKAG